MSIYTRTGDEGETSWLGSQRVSKLDPRIEACGALDETSAALGLARALGLPAPIDEMVAALQCELLAAGARICGPEGGATLPQLGPEQVAGLERAIDAQQAELEPLRTFVLCGGTPGAAALHLARTICRRAERRLLAVEQVRANYPVLLAYLNRLSDLLFVLARRTNALLGAAETRWPPHRPG